jgi:hypothetical protein
MKFTRDVTVGIIIVVLWAGSLFAEDLRMTTPIPRSILAPERSETRLGTLKFFDGFPDNDTVERIYDNLDFQRAVQAYLIALPPVSQAGMRTGLRQWGPDNQTVLMWENLIDSHTLTLGASDNSIYGFVWLDLNSGPLVIEAPPKILGLVDDFWYRWVADIGATGQDGGRGGRYLILPPNYTGTVPEGYLVVRARTFGNWFSFSSLILDGGQKPSVELIRKKLRIYALGDAAHPPLMNFVDASGQPFSTIGRADYSFWSALNQAVQEEPSNSLDPDTLGLYSAIGIEKGKPFNPDERMKKILIEAATVGDATARTIAYKTRQKDAYYYANSAWRRPFLGSYAFEQNGVRNLDGYIFYYFRSTGVSPAMQMKMVGEGSQYVWAVQDSKGGPLDGGRTYALHLPAGIPVKELWSLIVYSNQTRSMLQTDQQFPSVNSLTKGLLVNADKSVDVYFGPEAPAGKENNWIQTIPGKGWNVILRLYAPLEPWFAQTWRPGEIEVQLIKNTRTGDPHAG